jgi:hypothetical protein
MQVSSRTPPESDKATIANTIDTRNINIQATKKFETSDLNLNKVIDRDLKQQNAFLF